MELEWEGGACMEGPETHPFFISSVLPLSHSRNPKAQEDIFIQPLLRILKILISSESKITGLVLTAQNSI